MEAEAGLRAVLTTLRQRGAAMRRLTTLGLAPGLLRQLWSMDPAASLAYARGILADAGSIRSLNRTQFAIARLTDQQGQFAGRSLYGQAVAAARGLVQGLRSQRGPLARQMRELADVMVAEIKARLKIHSPSLVFAEIGGHIGAGLAEGVVSATPVAHQAIADLAAVPAFTAAAFDVPLPEGYQRGHDGGTHLHFDKWADQNVQRQVNQGVAYVDLARQGRERAGRRR
ncbi:MAG: hypothetical protein ACJ74O_01550 [Frankiaceae bacterium]